MDKQALIEKIKGLDGLTNDEKSTLLGLLRSHKKYGLVWEDKPEDVEERLRDELPVLTEVKERALISEAPDAPNHILIEGDNLEALTALSYTHEGKVDVIYIDPPYNTGNKDFIYNDRFVDSEDDYRHSKWLSFMERRLRIARRLLSMGGVIFISIDDNEQAQLKLLCDEIFGAARFLGEFIHQRAKGGGQAKHIVKGHDYILCYAHDATIAQISRPKVIQQGIVVHNGIECLRNDDVIRKTFGKYDKTLGDRRCFYEELIEYKGLAKKNEVDKLVQKGIYCLEKNKTGMHTIVEYIPVSSARSKHYSIIKVLSEIGKQELEDIGISNFDYPKPLELIRLLTGSIYRDDTTILDFFAGSGTTLHATMQLNAEDGGHRKCILVTNNENGICENVTYERNKRVIQGYTTPKGEEVPGLTANTLRYYKTDFISRDRTQRNMHALVEAATDLLCIKEDLYEEQTHFGRYKTHPKALRYFAQGSKRMLVLYRDEYTEEVAAEIENIELPQDEKIKIYIFSPDRYAYDDMFENVADKVMLVALPAAIYDAYKKVLPKRKEKLLELATEDKEANEEGGEE